MVLEDEKSGVQESVLPSACNLTAVSQRDASSKAAHCQAWHVVAGEPVWLRVLPKGDPSHE